MTEQQENYRPAQPIAEAVIQEKSTPWLVWMLPMIALVIGGWLAYKYYNEKGVEVLMHFPYGSELKPGETELKFEGTKLGYVKSTILSEDLSGIDAIVVVDKRAAVMLQEDTLFWLVKPRVTLSGVTGLETLVSGSYLTFQMGKTLSGLSRDEIEDLEPSRFEYTVLDDAPLKPSYMDGLQFSILSDQPATISVGAPISYKKFTIGEVEAVELTDNDKIVRYRVFIEKKYKHLVNSNTRFWNSSGIQVDGNLNNINVKIDSLVSVLVGGISLINPYDSADATTIDKKHEFKLYPDLKSARSEGSLINIRFKATENITEAMPLKFEGIQVGEVSEVKLDDSMQYIDAQIKLYDYNSKIAKAGAQFWVVKAKLSLNQTSNLSTLISGEYIAVRLGSGKPQQQFTALDKAPLTRYTSGKILTLVSKHATAISEGAPITFNKVKIGQVEHAVLVEHGKHTHYRVYIQPEYTYLINDQSVFWDSSGIKVDGSINNLDINIDSLASIVMGGIAMSNPSDLTQVKAVKRGHQFTLFASEADAVSEHGFITIQFSSAADLKKNMPLKYNGIQIGKVESLKFGETLEMVIARVRINDNVKEIARAGAEFWVVKPEIGLVNTRNIETVITGNYLTVKLGQGKPQHHFMGLTDVPAVAQQPHEDVLKITLNTPMLGSIKPGVKIYYRNIAVGQVDGAVLATDATQVHIHASIAKKYAPLIRENTRFWNVSGLEVDFGLLSGLQFDTNSMESILEGGIAFATPNNDQMGVSVQSGAEFDLVDDPQKEWLLWQPSIELN